MGGSLLIAPLYWVPQSPQPAPTSCGNAAAVGSQGNGVNEEWPCRNDHGRSNRGYMWTDLYPLILCGMQ